MTFLDKSYREFKLDNGLVVAIQNTPTQTVSAKLRVNYGSSHERENEEGMAHFLEHCLVTGGSQRYDPMVADSIRGQFGYSNAFTNIGRTTFDGQMLAEDIETWLGYISDHAFKPRFDTNRVKGERERVLREISDAKSNPTYKGSREFCSVFYGGHPKGIFVLGNEEVVRNADGNSLASFHSRGFHPNNMDLIIAGGLPGNIEDLIKKYFGSVSSGENTRKEFPELNPFQDRQVIHINAPEMLNEDHPEDSSAYISLDYIGPIAGHEDEYAVRTINQILGGDTNSFLFQNLGLKKGLAYSSGVAYDGNFNVGQLGVHASVPAKRIDEAVDGLFEEIDRMKNQKVEVKSLDRIRKMAKYHLAEVFESNGGHVGVIEMKLDEGLTPESFMSGWDKLNPDTVLEVANRYFPDKDNSNYVLYIRDPLKE